MLPIPTQALSWSGYGYNLSIPFITGSTPFDDTK